MLGGCGGVVAGVVAAELPGPGGLRESLVPLLLLLPGN